MPNLEFLARPLFQQLTSALLHFLWQGLLVAVSIWLLLSILRPRTAQARYGLLLAALAALPLCPLVTFWQLEPREVRANPDLALPRGTESETWQQPAAAADRVPQAPAETSWSSAARFVGATIQPYALAAWFLGVSLLGVRLLLGVVGVASLRRRHVTVAPAVVERVVQLSRRLGLTAVPGVVGSRHVGEALATGLWRPMVLLPLSWLSEAPPDVLDAVIAHELAHIRRRDLWVNAFQRVTETLLFYHPAVWWISSRLTQERELCCDSLAVSVTGERVVYARALEFVARKKSSERNLVLTAGFGGNKMAVLKRVRHVLYPDNRDAGGSGWSAGLIVVTVPLLMWLAVPSTSADTPDEKRPEREAASEESADHERPREAERTDNRDRHERNGRGERERRESAEPSDREQTRQIQSENELLRERDRARREVEALRQAVRELQEEVRRLRGRRPDGTPGRPVSGPAEPAGQPAPGHPHAIDFGLGRFSFYIGRIDGPEHHADEKHRHAEKKLGLDLNISKPRERGGKWMAGTGVNGDAGVTGTIVLDESNFKISVEPEAHKPTEPPQNRRHMIHGMRIERGKQPEANARREERKEEQTEWDWPPRDPRLKRERGPRPPHAPTPPRPLQPLQDNPLSPRQPDSPRQILRDRDEALSGDVIEMIEQLRREVEELRRELRRRDESDKEVQEPRSKY